MVQGSPNNIFFVENALKKRLYIFSNFFLYFKVQSLRLIMENNFIQMAAWAGHAVASTIGPIFKHIVDCVQLYFTNGFTNIVKMVYRRGCQFLSLFSQDNEHMELTVLLFFKIHM